MHLMATVIPGTLVNDNLFYSPFLLPFFKGSIIDCATC